MIALQPVEQVGNGIAGRCDLLDELWLLGLRTPQQVLVPAQYAGRWCGAIRVAMADAVGPRQIEDRQGRIVCGNVGQVAPGLGDELGNGGQALAKPLKRLALGRKLGECDPEHAIDIEARIACPGPRNFQQKGFLVEAGTDGQPVGLLGTLPAGDIQRIEAIAQGGQLLGADHHRVRPPVCPDLAFGGFIGAPDEEFVKDFDQIVPVIAAVRHSG